MVTSHEVKTRRLAFSPVVAVFYRDSVFTRGLKGSKLHWVHEGSRLEVLSASWLAGLVPHVCMFFFPGPTSLIYRLSFLSFMGYQFSGVLTRGCLERSVSDQFLSV